MSKQFEALYGPYFTFDEFQCKCDQCDIQPLGLTRPVWFVMPEFNEFMQRLIEMRVSLGFPFHINSGYRCPDYNDSLYYGNGEHDDGPHTKGAADISVSFERMYRLVAEATNRGMGVGIKQHGGVTQRFVHLDNLGSRLWTYP